MSNNSDVSIVFSDLWQEAIIGYMFKDYDFFIKCKNLINYRWFTNPLLSEIANQLYAAYDKLKSKRLITAAEFEGIIISLYVDVQTQNQYKNQVTICLSAVQSVGMDILTQHMTSWIKIVKLNGMLKGATDLYNNRKWDIAQVWLKDQLDILNQASFEPGERQFFTNPELFFEQQVTNHTDCMTLGHPEFDELCLMGARKKEDENTDPKDLNTLTNGGLKRGDTTVVIGPTNSGKTNFTITVATVNVIMKKHVLYIPAEGDTDDLMSKLYQSLIKKSKQEITSTLGVDETKKILQAASSLYNKYLHYAPFLNPSKKTLENVMSYIELAQEELKSSNDGKGFDLVIVDYPGRLTTKYFEHKKVSLWEEQAYINQRLMDLARFHKYHLILPAQTNREGYKTNLNDNGKLVDLGDIGGSFNIVKDADNVIIINRSKEDEAQNLVQFQIAKSRSAKKNYRFISQTDYARARTHGLSFHCTTLGPCDTLDREKFLEQIGAKFIKTNQVKLIDDKDTNWGKE